MSWINAIKWDDLAATVAAIVMVGGVFVSLGYLAINKFASLFGKWQEALSASEKLSFDREERHNALIEKTALRLGEIRASVEKLAEKIEDMNRHAEIEKPCLPTIQRLEKVLERLDAKERASQ